MRDEYKYLGMLQLSELDGMKMRKKNRDDHFNRVIKILKTSLNSRNTIQAVNTFATLCISYGLKVLD